MRAARVVALAAALALLGAASGEAKPGPEPQPAAEAWILVDARDGERLAADDPAAQRQVASATKLMTAFLALEEPNLERRVVAPPYEALAAESLLGLEAGERISLRDLVYSLILASANDGAVAVAEGVSGSVERFVREMNTTAAELGLDDTSYANPIGLDEPGNFSTAADLADLATLLLEDRVFRRVADTAEHTVRTDRATRSIVTRNDLLAREPWVTGVKTGYTIEAGNVLVGSGEREGTRLVAVVLGAPSESARDEGVLSLLDYGFSLYRRATPIAERETLARAEVDSGGAVRLLAKRPVSLSARRDQRVKTTVEAPDALTGPIRKGERLGRAQVSVDGRLAESVPLVAASSAPAADLGDDVRNNVGALALVGGGAVVILIAVLLALRARRADRSGDTRGLSR